jgi:hypothetical protein
MSLMADWGNYLTPARKDRAKAPQGGKIKLAA